ncbi:MAG: translation elongation factor Ts [Myxococcota bacterium]|nr:translation elongation factor Ts [Myxococcota bacterium]MEE2779771.1 translation elongation factor Ts [Myxococcota bacterium]
MSISAGMVKELRQKTGAGMMDCKRALDEANGDVEAAIVVLQKKQLTSVGKKQGRVAAEGYVGSYIHGEGRIGVLIEVNCETDFVARGDDFKAFVRDIAMHVAAVNPTVVNAEDLDQADIDQQKEIFLAQAMSEGKPEHIAEKMIEGRLKKWKREVVLMDQLFVKDTDKSILDVQNDITVKLGEKISIRRFVRFAVGEGMEKREDDFAAEVAAQANS